jgi:CYTH domain-containing protein
MPIENERKFVLDEDGRLEPRLAQTPGVTRSCLTQAYLDSPGVRIRSIESAGTTRHIFGFKRPVDGQMVEIETEIDATDFNRLWTLGRETLNKTRYSWADGRFHWDTDFFKTADGRTYFALAEVEMPEHEQQPPEVPPRLASHLLGAAPFGDPRFTSKRLANQAHAEALLADIRTKGTVS